MSQSRVERKVNMKLRARVRSVGGESRNYLGTVENSEPIAVKRLPNPEWLEISQEPDGFFLLYIDANGDCFADTWHQTLESAQREALLGFKISPEDWKAIA